MLERLYKTNLTLIMAQELSLVQLGEGDDWGVYVSEGVNHFGTPLMLRGTKQEIIDFLADRNLTHKVEF